MGIKYPLHVGMDQPDRLSNIGCATQSDKVDTQWGTRMSQAEGRTSIQFVQQLPRWMANQIFIQRRNGSI